MAKRQTKRKAGGKKDEKEGLQELIWLPPSELGAHPDNWRVHDRSQKEILSAAIRAGTFIDPILYNLRTNRIVDGHGRKQVAIRDKISHVPVLTCWLSDEQEILVLTQKDNISALAKTNPAALQSLLNRVGDTTDTLKKLRREDKSALKRLNNRINSHAEDVASGKSSTLLPHTKKRVRLTDKQRDEKEKEEVDEVYDIEIKEDVIFSSDLPFGLPPIREDMLAVDVPTTTYNRLPDTCSKDAWYCFSSRPWSEGRVGGTLGFYTEDWRFGRCYDRPAPFVEELLEAEWSAVVEPDFSMYGSWPEAVRIHNLYKSRWCARFWQQFDIKIIPKLPRVGFGRNPEKDAEIFYGSLPKKLPLVAVQARMTTKNSPDHWNKFLLSLKLAKRYIKFDQCVIYGGLELRRHFENGLPKGPKYTLLDSYTTSRREVYENGR